MSTSTKRDQTTKTKKTKRSTMKTDYYLTCKKTLKKDDDILFEENMRYKYHNIFEKDKAILLGTIFVYYDEFNKNPYKRGMRFYEQSHHNISHYFYNKTELRQQKLKKLKNV